MRGRSRVGGALIAVALLASLVPGPASAAVEKIPTTLTITTSPNPAWVGEPVTITYTVSPIPDGGYVTEGSEGIPIDPATGQASFTRTYIFAGAWEISAWYQGTDTYQNSPITTTSTLVRQHPVAATMSIPDPPIWRGDAFDVVVDLDEVPPSGTVVIEDVTFGLPGPGAHGTWFGRADVTGEMPIEVHVGGMEPGTYLVRANYLGTDEYAAAVSATQSITISDRPTTTTASLRTDPIKWGERTILDVTVSPIPDDGGGVRITRDGSTEGWATMDWSTGHGTFELEPDEPGAHAVVAEFFPAAWPYRYGPSSDSVVQTVSDVPIDPDPPVATFVINGDAPLTTDPWVVLTLHATDASPPLSVRISCDLVEWVAGATVDGDQGWVVNCGSGVEGPMTLYAEFRDAFGNKVLVSDSIVLENAGPIGTIILIDGSTVTIWPTVTVDVPAVDAGSGVALVALSNDGATWTERSYAPSQTWQLSPGDGLKTVYSKWRDGYGHWSAPKQATIKLDSTPPTGSISVASGAATTRSAQVTVNVVASDAVTGVSHVALSNNGSTWTTMPYQASVAWTLPGTYGTRTVWARWADAAGNWSVPRSDTIDLDTLAPTVSAHGAAATRGSSIGSSGGIPLTLTWTAADLGTGITRYELIQSTDAGPWVSLGSSITTRQVTRSIAPGHNYAFRVRAIDRAGNVGLWRSVGPFTATLASESTPRATYAGSWTTMTGTAYTDGRLRRTKDPRATVTYAFTGSAVAWVAGKGSTYGSVKVYVDGVYAATVNLNQVTSSARAVVFSTSWATRGAHKLTLANAATAGHPYANVDGFVSLDGLPAGSIQARR